MATRNLSQIPNFWHTANTDAQDALSDVCTPEDETAFLGARFLKTVPMEAWIRTWLRKKGATKNQNTSSPQNHINAKHAAVSMDTLMLASPKTLLKC